MPENYFDERKAKSYVDRPSGSLPTWPDQALPWNSASAPVDWRYRSASAAFRVHGIDLSPDMIAALRAKPGTDGIDVAVGDFATTRVGGTFKLAYLVRKTITNLTTQDDQVECFRNAAAHLEPGGGFVIEVYIPDLQRAPARAFRPAAGRRARRRRPRGGPRRRARPSRAPRWAAPPASVR